MNTAMTVDLGTVFNMLLFVAGVFGSIVLYFLKAEQARMTAGIEKAEKLASEASSKVDLAISEKLGAIEKHRIRPLEEAGKEVREAVASMRAEMIKLFGDLKVELVKGHPTREDLASAMSGNSERLQRIEEDIRKLLERMSDQVPQQEKSRRRP